jgi:hypothetical protein
MKTRAAWTPDMVRRLLRERQGAAQRSWQSVAEIFDLSVMQCQHKYNNIMAGICNDHSNAVDPVERHCPKCHDSFVAEGRFNRLCQPCKDTVIFSTDDNQTYKVAT